MRPMHIKVYPMCIGLAVFTEGSFNRCIRRRRALFVWLQPGERGAMMFPGRVGLFFRADPGKGEYGCPNMRYVPFRREFSRRVFSATEAISLVALVYRRVVQAKKTVAITKTTVANANIHVAASIIPLPVPKQLYPLVIQRNTPGN